MSGSEPAAVLQNTLCNLYDTTRGRAGYSCLRSSRQGKRLAYRSLYQKDPPPERLVRMAEQLLVNSSRSTGILVTKGNPLVA